MKEQYPSGRMVTTAYDGADRPAGVSGTYQGAVTNYVPQTGYAPQGALSYLAYANSLARSWTYNARLQPGCFWDALGNSPNAYLFTMCPQWGTTNNNGNLLGASVQAGGPGAQSALTTFNQSYSYDNVNRLTAASDSGGWSQSFAYDAYGNLWQPATSGVGLPGGIAQSNVFNGNNQVNGGAYDKSGNQTVVNGNGVTYDALNRQTGITEPASLGGGTAQYLYDGLGQRVGKVLNGTNQTVYVYDALGTLTAEYGSGTANAAPCQTCYLSWDHLGTPRLITDQNGNVVARHDYLPFGFEVPAGSAGRSTQWSLDDGVEQKFTGQRLDGETGEDYFHARYYTSAQGRFDSPDPENAGADLTNPQSWNGYAYVGNNPLSAVDPSGMDFCDPFDDDGDPICGWPPPEPPPCFFGCGGGGGGGGSRGGGSDSGQPADNTPLPPNSFPGGETLGVPPGMSVPLPSPAVLLGLGLNLDCEFGVCVPGVGASPFLGPAAATLGGVICVGSGACEVAVAIGGAVIIGYETWQIADYIYKSTRPSGVPDNWTEPSKKGGGVIYVNPKNPHDRIRVMPGNPGSPNPAQQKPYKKIQKGGKCFDDGGNEVPCDSAEAHIPL